MITFSDLAGSILDRLRKNEDPEQGINEKGFGVISEKQYNFLIKLAHEDSSVKFFPEESTLFKKVEGIAKVGKKKELPCAVYVHKGKQGNRYAMYSDAYALWPYEQTPPVLFLPELQPDTHQVIDCTPNALAIESKASEYLVRLADVRSKNYWFRPTGVSPLRADEHDTVIRLWSTEPGACVPATADIDGNDSIASITVPQVKLTGCGKKTDVTLVYLFRNHDGVPFPFIHSSAHERI